MKNGRFFFSVPFSVWIVSIACMCVSVSVAISMSIAPLFMVELGISMVALGTIDGIAEGISQLSRLLAGFVIDYIGRKKYSLLTGFFIAIVSKPFFIIANSAGMIAFSKFLERISNGIMAIPRDSYVASAVSTDKKGSSVGLMMTLKTLGISVGSVAVGCMLYIGLGYKTILWIGCFFVILGFIIVRRYVPEQSVDTKKKNTGTRASNRNRMSMIWKTMSNLDSRYWSIIIVASAYYCARIPDGFLMLRYKELGGGESVVASIIGIFNIVSFLTCYPLGTLSDKFGRTALLIISFLSLVVAHLCFTVATTTYTGMIGVCLWGVQRGSSQVLFTSIIADSVPAKILGTALGIFYVVLSVVNSFTGYIAGSIAEEGSLQDMFFYCIKLSCLALFLLIIRFFFMRRKKVISKVDNLL